MDCFVYIYLFNPFVKFRLITYNAFNFVRATSYSMCSFIY